MTSRLSIQPSQSVQLYTIGQQLGINQGGQTVQLNAIRSGSGNYWNGADLSTSSQAGNMNRFRGVNIYTCQAQASVTTSGTASVWVNNQTAGSALTISTTSGATLYLRNDQQLVGAGGNGGNGADYINQATGPPGAPGGPAITTQAGTVQVYNYGTIYGGGGGGGGGAGLTNGMFNRGGGGGGGGGTSGGLGGNGVGNRPGQPGQPAALGGAGGAGGNSGGPGGNGGAAGSNGTPGTPTPTGTGGSGGTAGASISGATSVQWTVGGTHN